LIPSCSREHTRFAHHFAVQRVACLELIAKKIRNQRGETMRQSSVDVRQFHGIRRWPRYEIDLPVRILALNGVVDAPVNGRGHEISRAGMALQAGLNAAPGDLMQLQFPTSEPSRVVAIVRNRVGNLMGLEFLSQLPPDDETKGEGKAGGRPVVPVKARKFLSVSCTPQTLYDGLRRKQEQQRQVEKEIEALRLAIALLADDDKNSCGVMPPRRAMDVRPWPLQS
jgi:hypothetical protein